MAKRVAVIADATSVEYFFPYWYRYYGGQFGHANLHIVTYAGLKNAFSGLELGSVEELDSCYDDAVRATHVSKRVADLLTQHEVVVRCDIDEFLIPDPKQHASLAAYVDVLQKPYVTAMGLDLVEVEDDPPLMLDGRALLKQRPWCIQTASLNKTSVVMVPVNWAPGFHAASVPPVFDALYLVHTKFADVRGRVAWFAEMLGKTRSGSGEFVYYSDARAKLEGYHRWLMKLERIISGIGVTGQSFTDQFLFTVERDRLFDCYCGQFIVENKIRHLDAFLGSSVMDCL